MPNQTIKEMTAEEYWRPIIPGLLRRIVLPCLSIKQPWPYRIFHEGKDVENRTWETNFRGAVLIHAGKVPDCPKKDWFPRDDAPLGCICGLARIIDCVDHMDSDWFVGPYGFVLAPYKILFRTPIPYKGRLGFFDVPGAMVGGAILEGIYVQ